MNLTGLPVTWRTDSAAPPRESPSALVRITPVSGTVSEKTLAVLAASWPVIESTTNRVSIGFSAACSAAISFIIASSMEVRPAVSTISTSKYCLRAYSTAAAAMARGSCPASLGNHSTPTPAATILSCSMAAGR